MVKTTAHNWEVCRKKAAKQGDWQVALSCPVIYQPHRQPEWQLLPYEAVKEIHKAVKKGFQLTLLKAK